MKRLRLKCDASDPTRVIDEITGKPPVLVRGESYRLEIGLFIAGEMSPPTLDRVTTISVADAAGLSYDLSTVSEPASLTAAQFHNGVNQHYAIVADETYTDILSAGRATMYVTSTQTGSGRVVWGVVKLDVVDLNVSVTNPQNIPAPATIYTRSQSDAKFALITSLATTNSSVSELQSAANVLYSAQTLNGTQKAQARTNIGAAAAGAAATSIPSNELALDTATSWWGELGGNVTLTTIGTPIIGQIYQLVLAQDSTGNRAVTFPGVVDSGAIVNPTPSSQTAFRLDVRRTNGTTGTEIRVSPYDNPVTPPDPTFEVAFGRRNRVTISGNNITEFSDPWSGVTWDDVGTTPTVATLNNRQAANMSSGGLVIKTTPTAALATAAAGVTVMAIFSTASTSDQRILHAGPLGLSLDVRGGNVEFGNEGNSGQRVSVPYSSSGDATLVVATFTPGSPATALIYVGKHGGGAATKYSASATAGSANGNWEVGQASGGTARFNGKLACLRFFDKPLTWAQIQELVRISSAEFGIVT